MRVNPERHAHVGVPRVLRDDGWIVAERNPQADVGVAQRVRRQLLGDRRQVGLLELLIGQLDRLVEDSLARVVARPRAALAGGEDLVVGR